MFPITLTIHNTAQLNAVMAALADKPVIKPGVALESGEFIPAGVSAEEKAAVLAPAEAPGKPSAATTARSPRTAEAAPSQPAPSAAAPAPAPTPTPPAADAASASPQVTYPDLQKAVLTLHKMDPTAAQPIARGLGADTFKLLKPEQWAEALRLVNAAIDERKGA
jgi:hypothetical protein